MQIAIICFHTAVSLLVTNVAQPAAQSPRVTSVVKSGVTVVRHAVEAPGKAEPDAEAAPSQETADGTHDGLRVLLELERLSLIHIRPRASRLAQNGDSTWTYKPKRYHGYHPKPNFEYHERAGWRYDARRGWRYIPEPEWVDEPGAMEHVLRRLPTGGEGWHLTRWQ